MEFVYCGGYYSLQKDCILISKTDSIPPGSKKFKGLTIRWTDEEDQTLKASFSEGADISKQSALLGGNPAPYDRGLKNWG